MLAQSLALVWRADLFSLGHHGFFAVGAYTAVIASQILLPHGTGNESIFSNIQSAILYLFFVFLISGLCAGLFGALLAYIFRKIRGDYFAVATLIFAEIILVLINNWDNVGGPLGFEVDYLIYPPAIDRGFSHSLTYALIGLALNFSLFVIVKKISKSELGIVVSALATDSIAARASGINVELIQGIMLTLGAAAAGIAGAYFLHMSTMISPSDFTFSANVMVLLFVVLGSAKRVSVVISTVIIYAFYESIKARFFGMVSPDFGVFITQWQLGLLGIGLVIAIVAKWHFRHRFEKS